MKKLLFTTILLTSIHLLGQKAESIKVLDTRDTKNPPTSYNNEVKFEFKRRNAIGFSGLTYSGLMTIAPWVDNSGNDHYQLSFNSDGLFYRTGMPDNEKWGYWRKILTSHTDVPINITTNAHGVLNFKNPNDNWQYIQFIGKEKRKAWMGIDPSNNFCVVKENGGNIIFNGTNVGIGTASPKHRLDVNGNIKGSVIHSETNENGETIYGKLTPYSVSFNRASSYIHQLKKGGNIKFQLSSKDGEKTADVNAMSIISSGTVGINTFNPDPYYKLDVRGKVRACEIKIDVKKGCDFVFEKTYDLPTLKEVEKFIQKNKHLPEIAPAKKMEAEGIDMSKTTLKLLQKIEELTLYTIQQQKELDAEKEKNSTLEQRLSKLEQLIHEKRD